MTAPLNVWRVPHETWLWHCNVCNNGGWDDSPTATLADALTAALDHLRSHAPVLCDATGMAAMFGPAAVWCPLCDQRIANGIAEDEARHVAAEHWAWHLAELGRTA